MKYMSIPERMKRIILSLGAGFVIISFFKMPMNNKAILISLFVILLNISYLKQLKVLFVVQVFWSLIKGKTKFKIEENLSWNKRYRNYTEKLKSGNIIMAGEVFREINDISKKKELSFGEQKILETAFNRIVKELSASLKQKEEDIYIDIKKLLIKPDSINI